MKNVNLIRARTDKNLTQDQLGKILGYSGKQAVSNWENNHINPPLEIAMKISIILEKDIFFLFTRGIQESHTCGKQKTI